MVVAAFLGELHVSHDHGCSDMVPSSPPCETEDSASGSSSRCCNHNSQRLEGSCRHGALRGQSGGL